MRILLNGINAFSSGGVSVVKNIVENISKIAPDIIFDVILPKNEDFEKISTSQNMHVNFMSRNSWHVTNRFLDIYFNIEKWCKYYKSDLCFTLGDIGPIQLKIPHIVLLQQAMIVYKGEDYEKYWSFKEKLKFNYTRWHFLKMTQNVDIVTVQSPVMADRLQKVYSVPNKKIRIIPSTLPSEYNSNISNEPNNDIIKINKECRLLFLSACYPHKNHAIITKVAEELQKRKLDKKVHIFLTIDDSEKLGKNILKRIEPYSNCISNLGILPKNKVPGAYKAATALFLPTLVESFGLIYLEAMAYSCDILTSDRDFSRWICGDLAMYFDPMDAISIANTIENFISNPTEAQHKKHIKNRLNDFPNSWENVVKQYAKMIKEFI